MEAILAAARGIPSSGKTILIWGGKEWTEGRFGRAIYAEEKGVRDGNLITAVYFAYLPDHFRLIMSAMLEQS